MINFITENIEYIAPIIIAIVTGGLISYRKSKSTKVVQKNIRTKSGDVIAGNKTSYKDE